MSVKKSNFRFQHVSKTPEERAAYQEFLREYQHLEKTEEEPVEKSIELDQTSQSSFENEKNNPTNLKVTRKSFKLKVLDFLRDNMTVAVLGGFLLFVLIGYWTISSNVKAQDEKINNINELVKILFQDNKENIRQNQNLNVDLQVFKARVEKDIEYIKTNLGFPKQ
jgi:hypothetical protein